MREILFRGKLTDDSKWVYGCLLDKIYGAVPAIMSEQSVDDAFNLEFEYNHVKEKTVGQYTGMKDKNGKQIFEGDILKFSDCGIYPVWWDADFFTFGSCWFSDFDPLYKYDRNKIEVIGNIHDNPELLENP